MWSKQREKQHNANKNKEWRMQFLFCSVLVVSARVIIRNHSWFFCLFYTIIIQVFEVLFTWEIYLSQAHLKIDSAISFKVYGLYGKSHTPLKILYIFMPCITEFPELLT